MDRPNKTPRLCITLPYAYPLYHPEAPGIFGGWEVRITLIARELAKRGRLQVLVVVGDHGQPNSECIDGVRLVSWTGRDLWGIPSATRWNPFPKNSTAFNLWDLGFKKGSAARAQFLGKPFGRVLNYRITPEMISVYDEVDADIYLVPGNSVFSAEVAYYCKVRGKKYVFLAGSDIDYAPEIKDRPTGADLYSTPYPLKLYNIQNADLHIVQNEAQADLLRDHFGRSGVMIKNPIDLHPQFPRSPEPRSILWVGKSDERVKRPSVVLELARRLPEYPFVMIMNPADPQIHQACLQQARNLPNLTVIERVPFREIERYYAEARIHLNTSTFEGFPNTYLQAAKYGVPTVSLCIDPGGMLSHYRCGLVSGEDLNQAEADIRRMMTDDELYRQTGDRCLDYVKEHHDQDKIITAIETEMLRLLLQ